MRQSISILRKEFISDNDCPVLKSGPLDSESGTAILLLRNLC